MSTTYLTDAYALPSLCVAGAQHLKVGQRVTIGWLNEQVCCILSHRMSSHHSASMPLNAAH